MQISKSVQESALIVTIAGKMIDIQSLNNFKEDVIAEFNANDKVIIEMSEVIAMNSTALGSIIQLSAKSRQLKKTFLIAKPSDFVQNLLRITKIDTIIPVYDDVETALTK